MLDNIVTSKRIRKLINHVSYYNNGKTTICIVFLRNGFEVVGTSACVDKGNFDEDLGKEYSLKDAIGKIEELEAYRIQWELYNDQKQLDFK